MGTIHHCGKARRGTSYWLRPNSTESRFYRHVVLVNVICPACGRFMLEWYGIDLLNRRTPQHRVSWKHHAEWVIRSKTDIDTTVDCSQWESIKKGVYRVRTSMHGFPWIQHWTMVR